MEATLVAVRFVHFSAAMLLLGVTSFAAALAPAELVALRPRLVRRVTIGLVVLIGTSGVAWLALEAGAAGNGWSDVLAPATWTAILTETSFGRVWIWHLVLIALLGIGMALPGRKSFNALLVVDGLLLLSLGFVGHAAMEQGAIGLAHQLNHALHILAAGFWVGSLLPLAAGLGAMGSKALQGPASTMLIRFSGLGHIAVAITLITGLVNTALTLGHLPLDWRSPYQTLFAVKLGLVVLMLAVALGNRYLLTPGFAVEPAAARRLIAGTLAELILGAAVIGIVSAFATWDPV